MKAKLVSQEDFDYKTPGTYCLNKKEKNPVFILPCGHHFAPQGKWEEQNVTDDNKITLTPSILCLGSTREHKECWHGYLTNGEFKEC